MTWERDTYLADVLEPARKAGNVPPPDLYVRYGLSRDIRDEAAFRRQIADVLAFWRELKSRRAYARLAETLIGAHAQLERDGRLTLKNFAERYADAHRAQVERLNRLAKTEAGVATHVGSGTVTRLRDALGGTVSDADVTEALARAGVRIIETFPELPAKPHPKQGDLTRYLAQLSIRLAAEVVFGGAVGRGFRILSGFRLADGRTLTEEEIAAARGRIAALPYSDPAKTPSENVLAILRAAARVPGELDTLLLSEILERLRPLARGGFVQRAIAGQARELGLHADEAGLIAAALLAPDTHDALSQKVADELTRGMLRAAQRMATSLPADDPLLERIAAVDASVIALIRRAEAEEASGRPEPAAALLAEAIGIARDDPGIPARLAAIPPPPPRDAIARMDGNHVLITWRPSLTAAGGVQYMITRGQDQAPGLPSQGVAVVTRTERTDVTDAAAPAGFELFYSVFAARGGEAWSPPAVATTMFTPDVTEVSVTSSDTSVDVSWRTHPGARAVHVVRREERPPTGIDDGMPVEASLTGFTEAGLGSGTEYFYRIVTSYLRADGQGRCSAGVVVRAVPEPVLLPVATLDVSGPCDDQPAVLAIWTPPPYGRVRLVRSDKPLPWPPGTYVGLEEAAALAEIPGVPRRGTDGRDVLELRLPSGRHLVTPLSVGRNAAVIGHGVQAWLVEPVDGLSADRLHDEVQLGWIWPDHATDALVRWPGGEHRCSRRVYDDEGGVMITVGAAETTVEVRAVYPRPDGRLVSPGARVRVPARGIAVSYRIRSPSRWRPGERTFEFITERDTRLPALVVVRTTGPYPPDDPHEGETIARLEPRDITEGQPVTFTVAVARGPGWVACFVDPATPESHVRGILLYPPPAEEMRMR